MMQEWVDLKTVQWAYAHSQKYQSPEFPKGHAGIENAFGFKVVTDLSGSVTRYYSSTRKFYTDEDRQILVDFKDEKCLTMFLLRWS